MNISDLKKLALPATLGALIAAAGAAWVLHEFWSLSIGRGGGKYEDSLPAIVVPKGK
jgi:hypothetical protein